MGKKGLSNLFLAEHSIFCIPYVWQSFGTPGLIFSEHVFSVIIAFWKVSMLKITAKEVLKSLMNGNLGLVFKEATKV
jgi:hypothetical protein